MKGSTPTKQQKEYWDALACSKTIRELRKYAERS